LNIQSLLQSLHFFGFSATDNGTGAEHFWQTFLSGTNSSKQPMQMDSFISLTRTRLQSKQTRGKKMSAYGRIFCNHRGLDNPTVISW
jgi:hypothetical protein